MKLWFHLGITVSPGCCSSYTLLVGLDNVHAHFRWNLISFLTAQCQNWSGLLPSISIICSFGSQHLSFNISDCCMSISIHKCRLWKKKEIWNLDYSIYVHATPGKNTRWFRPGIFLTFVSSNSHPVNLLPLAYLILL